MKGELTNGRKLMNIKHWWNCATVEIRGFSKIFSPFMTMAMKKPIIRILLCWKRCWKLKFWLKSNPFWGYHRQAFKTIFPGIIRIKINTNFISGRHRPDHPWHIIYIHRFTCSDKPFLYAPFQQMPEFYDNIFSDGFWHFGS